LASSFFTPLLYFSDAVPHLIVIVSWWLGVAHPQSWESGAARLCSLTEAQLPAQSIIRVDQYAQKHTVTTTTTQPFYHVPNASRYACGIIVVLVSSDLMECYTTVLQETELGAK
jgi:hypothetical protein